MRRICNFAKPRRKKGDAPVNNNLALTPQKMLDMTRKGVAITSNIMANSEIEPTGSGLNVPIELRRGVHINDIWNKQQEIGKKYSKYNAWKKQQEESNKEVDRNQLNIA